MPEACPRHPVATNGHLWLLLLTAPFTGTVADVGRVVGGTAEGDRRLYGVCAHTIPASSHEAEHTCVIWSWEAAKGGTRQAKSMACVMTQTPALHILVCLQIKSKEGSVSDKT